MRLTATFVRNNKTRGKWGDGNGLWLQVSTPTQRSWLFNYTFHGKSRAMGLGSVADVTLAQAREKAVAARALVRDGIDPIEHRKAERVGATAATTSFADAASQYIAANEAGWRNAKHRQQWHSTLAAYVYPLLGKLAVAEITTDHVLKVLTPVWHAKPTTASRVRGRIETVLSYATVRGWRQGPNPALWRGHLALMLPAPRKLRLPVHHPALDWHALPAFMATLRNQPGMGAAALQFLILTATRSGEIRGATWSEVDLAHAVWNIPAARMKGARAHRVPLSRPAVALLEEVALARIDDASPLFPGLRGKILSNRSIAVVLTRMGREDLTVHGFRSSFRDWAAEATGHPNHVIEQALAHAIPSAVEAAYRRGDLFAKRVTLMAEWSEYLSRDPAQVVPLEPAKRISR